VIAAIAVVAFNGDAGDGGGTDPGATAQQSRVYRVAMSGAGPTPAAAGEAKLYPGDTGTGVHLEVSGLKPNDYDYELWCVRDDGWKISAGTFRVDANGHADVDLTTAAKPTDYDGLTIQARPSGAAADAKGVRVLAGRIKS
jgi:anti-sigma-K factor RskA